MSEWQRKQAVAYVGSCKNIFQNVPGSKLNTFQIYIRSSEDTLAHDLAVTPVTCTQPVRPFPDCEYVVNYRLIVHTGTYLILCIPYTDIRFTQVKRHDKSIIDASKDLQSSVILCGHTDFIALSCHLKSLVIGIQILVFQPFNFRQDRTHRRVVFRWLSFFLILLSICATASLTSSSL